MSYALKKVDAVLIKVQADLLKKRDEYDNSLVSPTSDSAFRSVGQALDSLASAREDLWAIL